MHANPTRSLATSLLDRRWVTFTVELVLVFVGILAALSVDGWVTERENRKSERIYLESLARDLSQFESELKEQIQFEDGIIRTGKSAYKILLQAEPGEHALALGPMLTHLYDRRTVFLESAAYTDLISTGNLELIRDRSLRDRIIRYFAMMERSELIIEKNNSFFVDGDYGDFLTAANLSPYLATSWPDATDSAIASGELYSRDLNPEMMTPRDDVLFKGDATADWTSFQRAVLWRSYVSSGIRNKVKGMLEATVELRSDLETHLEQ